MVAVTRVIRRGTPRPPRFAGAVDAGSDAVSECDGAVSRRGCDERLVWFGIGFDDHANNPFRLVNHGGTRQHTHLAYQRVDADQGRNLRHVAHKSVGVQLRSLVDEFPVQLLPSHLVLLEMLGAVMMVLGNPGRRERGHATDRRPCQSRENRNVCGIHRASAPLKILTGFGSWEPPRSIASCAGR